MSDPAKLTYVVGDATNPTMVPCVIAHVTNNRRGWGKGFVLALEARYPGLGARWKTYDQRLMDTRVEQVEPMIHVAHMCAQDGFKTKKNPVPLNYAALISCLAQLRPYASFRGCSGVHMPRIGSGLAGGNWQIIERLIQEELVDKGINVFVYDLPKE